MQESAKSINALMRHLRDNCNISISGSTDKKLLTQYGYYHAYKGYRFFKDRKNALPYTSFEEIVSMVEYDNKLKSVLYPQLMYVEMVLKNIVLDQLVPNMSDVSFDSIYRSKMSDEPTNKKLRLKRLRLKDKIHSNLSVNYNTFVNGKTKNKKDHKKDTMVSHFYNRGDEVPIWAIFEIISLGEFAKFTECLDLVSRTKIANTLKMDTPLDTNCKMLSNCLYTIKALRNAVAHNSIVFDVRFQDSGMNKNLITWVKKETEIEDVDFQYITDYIILICCLLKKVNADIERSMNFINQFEECIDELYEKVPINIYNISGSTNAKRKMASLKKYIKND